jgi:hypothetical protein
MIFWISGRTAGLAKFRSGWRQAREVADPVAVAVLERLDIERVEDRVVVPEVTNRHCGIPLSKRR